MNSAKRAKERNSLTVNVDISGKKKKPRNKRNNMDLLFSGQDSGTNITEYGLGQTHQPKLNLLHKKKNSLPSLKVVAKGDTLLAAKDGPDPRQRRSAMGLKQSHVRKKLSHAEIIAGLRSPDLTNARDQGLSISHELTLQRQQRSLQKQLQVVR